jgi:L-arabinose isomerase
MSTSSNHFPNQHIWFVTGSQDLYGEETLKQVAVHSQAMVDQINKAGTIPAQLVWKPVVLTSSGIAQVLRDANQDHQCIGIITWMHTFSPAKMWIRGLSIIQKPLLHLHTQFNRDIPWDSIDMDFMNLNQSAHGDREYGYIGARMGVKRTVVAGFWQDPEVQQRISKWVRAAAGYAEAQTLRIARFGDNMRKVAVTEGDKVEAEIALGYQVEGFGLGDLVASIETISEAQVQSLVQEIHGLYSGVEDLKKDSKKWNAVIEQLRIELGIKAFLDGGNFKAFTTTFENLHGLPQLPGLAAQRLMAQGYGFGAEGDWKHAGLLRVSKVMAQGMTGGTSFMEDYTYHMNPMNKMVLGAHMLEICPSIAAGKPSLQVHPLGIGGKADPARLVFNGAGGRALNASLVDMGNRLRLIVNTVEAIEPSQAMPKLPVARVLWKPEPDFQTGLEGWILAGGAHHTVFSLALTLEHFEAYSQMAGLELIVIDNQTNLRSLRNELLLADVKSRLG